jgi:hypothetical protein
MLVVAAMAVREARTMRNADCGQRKRAQASGALIEVPIYAAAKRLLATLTNR